jgi:hypothetical protein
VDAPETVESEKITNWNVDQSLSGSFLEENGEYAGISVTPDVFGYMNGYIETENVALMNDGNEIGELAISKDNAIAVAQNVLHELAIDYMVVDTLEKAQQYTCLSSSTFAEYSEKPTSKGYFIKFTRDFDGIAAITNNGVQFNKMDEFDYKAPLYPEQISIYVNGEGKIQSFYWSKPLIIEEKVTENVELLPFEGVKQRIRDMLIFINSYNSAPIKVSSMKINMTIVNVKDHLEEAMYVPAWFIYYSKIDENGSIDYTLALNAIDGGRILEMPVNISPEIQAQMDKDT